MKTVEVTVVRIHLSETIKPGHRVHWSAYVNERE